MKKILSVISVSLFIWGCSSSNIVSENAVKQALEIAYSQTAPMSWEDFGALNRYGELLEVKDYLKNGNFRKEITCVVLDESDVNGTKHIRACLLKNASTGNNPNLLVKALREPANLDIIYLVFYRDADETDDGIKYSTIVPVSVAVNLKTKKIGRV